MMKSTFLLICIAAAVGLLATAESKSEEQGKDTAPPTPNASDKSIGEKAGEIRDDNSLKMKLVWCPPGKFLMGNPESNDRAFKNEKPQAEVTLATGFWIGKSEVTQVEWKQVMMTEPWKGRQFTKEGDDYPTTYVTWHDAMKFCRDLTEQERKADRLPGGWNYTLPTEAQWEFACRAGAETDFSFGDDESKLGDYAWFAENARGAGDAYAHRVGQKTPNAWGLFDTHGNVWELCRDSYMDKFPGGRDPEVIEQNSARVMRGGSWDNVARNCRSAGRGRVTPDGRGFYLGFRAVLTAVVPSKPGR